MTVTNHSNTHAASSPNAASRRGVSPLWQPRHRTIPSWISLALTMVLMAAIPSVVRADQPVHCLRGQLYGLWHFYVSSEPALVNLYETDEVCTHTIPNKL